MKIKGLLILLLVLVTATTACKRKNIRGDLKNRREILQTYNWKLTQISGNGSMTSIPPCQQDNIYQFDPGGNGRYLEGEDNCLDSLGTGNAPTYTPFLWNVTGDLRYLYLLNYGGDPDKRFEWEITNMTFETMDVKYFDFVNNLDVEVRMKFSAVPK